MSHERVADLERAMRWECRYSSSEMMYLEVGTTNVKLYLDHSPDRADHYTFDQVLDGAMDNEVGGVFGSETLAELKDVVRAAQAA